jgi:hypothetical protein
MTTRPKLAATDVPNDGTSPGAVNRPLVPESSNVVSARI